MFFALSKVFWIVAEPGNALTLLLLLGVALLFARRAALARLGRGLVAVVALGMLTVAVTPLALWVARPLEDRFPQPSLPERIDGIVMLGGAVNPILSDDRHEASVNDAAERILGFVDLARRYPQAKLVFTGGSGSLFRQDLKEDASLRMALDEIGFDSGRVIYENQSRNTWENAVRSKALADPKPGETWFLVTSAMHMPRSVGIFHQVEWPVVPYPVDYRTVSRGNGGMAIAFDGRLSILTLALREWIGLLVYRCAGQSAALFPAP